MTLLSKDYLVCPWCGEDSGRRVDHLYDEAPRSFGTWYCDGCRQPIEGQVEADRSVTVRRSESKYRFTRSMALLRLDHPNRRLFFVLDHDRYHIGDGGDETDAENQADQSYFFEEHSCPTNWIGDCVAVIDDGDTDPHGFLKFVRAVDVPQDFDADDDENWERIFPEAFS